MNNVKWSKLIWMIVILLISLVITHTADKWTIPLQNDTTIAQVNGGDEELVVMHSTNSLLSTVRIYTTPVACLIIIMIAWLEILQMGKRAKEKEEEEKKKEAKTIH